MREKGKRKKKEQMTRERGKANQASKKPEKLSF